MEDRYIRQIRLDEVGKAGQKKLTEAKVLVVGAGGLGCPALQYLAAAGVGTLGIVDFDLVTLTNLHRQIVFEQSDVGRNKAEAAKEKLERLNSKININAYTTSFQLSNGRELLQSYDLVLDATDNFASRYCINDFCVILDKPMIYAALYKFQGQVAVFNYKGGPTYRCLFPTPPKPDEVPNCEMTGVLGVVPGLLGVLQATEVLKIILNLKTVLSGKLLCYDLLSHETKQIEIKPNRAAIARLKEKNSPKEELQLDCNDSLQIDLFSVEDQSNIIWVDVREKGELPLVSLNNQIHLPQSKWEKEWELLKNEEIKIVFCQSGQRSKKATALFRRKGILNCYSLSVGATTLQTWNQKVKK